MPSTVRQTTYLLFSKGPVRWKIFTSAQYFISSTNHVFYELCFCNAAFIFDLFSMVKNYKTFILWGPFNPHELQLLRMDHVACFWYAAFTLESYSSEKIQDESTVRQNISWRKGLNFENEPRVFYLIAQKFKFCFVIL